MFTASLHENLSFCSQPEPFQVQALISKFSMEAFVQAVLPWLAWRDEGVVDFVALKEDEVRNLMVRSKGQVKVAFPT
jgi:hypothetical protein